MKTKTKRFYVLLETSQFRKVILKTIKQNK